MHECRVVCVLLQNEADLCCLYDLLCLLALLLQALPRRHSAPVSLLCLLLLQSKQLRMLAESIPPSTRCMSFYTQSSDDEIQKGILMLNEEGQLSFEGTLC